MHASMHICICTCTHIGIHASIYEDMRASCMLTQKNVRRYARIDAYMQHMFRQPNTYGYMWGSTHIPAHVRTYARIKHIFTHIRIYARI